MENLTIAGAYRSVIQAEREASAKREREYEEQRKRDALRKPHFSKYCKRITLYRAAKLLNKIYRARSDAGLEPFTHAYDYALDGTCWMAKSDFDCVGRFGANSNEVVFVPEGITVKGCDSTDVFYVDDWEKNDFVPAYSNTV